MVDDAKRKTYHFNITINSPATQVFDLFHAKPFIAEGVLYHDMRNWYQGMNNAAKYFYFIFVSLLHRAKFYKMHGFYTKHTEVHVMAPQ